jgi:hypothetical protein
MLPDELLLDGSNGIYGLTHHNKKQASNLGFTPPQISEDKYNFTQTKKPTTKRKPNVPIHRQPQLDAPSQ